MEKPHRHKGERGQEAALPKRRRTNHDLLFSFLRADTLS